MMNIPQEISPYVVQSHGTHSSAMTSEYLYPATTVQHSHHSQSVATGGCDPSLTGDDINYYTNPANHSVTTSHPHSLGHYAISEGDNAPSLYGLVTATSVLSPNVNSDPSATSYASQLLHPHSTAISGSLQSLDNPVSCPNYTHHNGNSKNHHRSNSRTSSTHSHQSYTALSQVAATGPGENHQKMTGISSIDSSPSPYHQHHNHPKNFHHSYGSHRKRKSPVPIESEPEDDSGTCSSRRTTTPTDESSKKQNHSEIEKRRRDKMNTYITELSGMVPMCRTTSRKLDKLTVLRMAVQHMKTLRGSRIHSYTEGHYKPTFLTDDELKHLILQSAEGFLFVVGCDRGRLLYVSESVSQVLNYTQSDLLGQSWFDVLHPKDVATVKEQLTSSDLAPRERLIDAKTMLPVKGNVPQKANRLCPGARRSFFCRMKYQNAMIIKKESDCSSGCQRRKKASSSERKFCVIHCTGYLKSWAKVGADDAEETDDLCNLSCLVAVGRILKPITSPTINTKHRPVTFISRHAIDGKFVFVDQRTTLVVGFLPQELLGTSMYEYFHHDDITFLAEVHKTVLVSNESMTTQMYRFRTRSGNCVRLQSKWTAFRNPWTRDIEYIIARNTLTSGGVEPLVRSAFAEETFTNVSVLQFLPGNGNGGTNMGKGEIQRLMNSEVPFRKIGEQIADEMLESQRRNESSSSSSPVSVLESAAAVCVSITDLHIPPMLSTHTSSNILHSISAPQHSMALISQPNHGIIASQQNNIGSSGSVTQQQGLNQMNVVLPLRSRTADPLMGSAAVGSIVPTEEDMMYIIGESVLPESPHHPISGDGNDEAVMAVIMSLLEADAGLGGPVDFSGLPWPLP